MNQRDKKPDSRRGVNISFSELVQRIAQKDTKGAEQDPKQKRAKPKLPRRQKKVYFHLDRGLVGKRAWGTTNCERLYG
jgi:hypothetical protein